MRPFPSLKLLAIALWFVACGEAMPPPDGGTDAGTDAGSKGPRLSGLPDCGTPVDAGTVNELYANVVSITGCQAGGCHGPGTPFFFFQFQDAASFKAAMVNVKSSQVPSVNRVTPRDLDRSYLLYKLWGQQSDAGLDGTGDRMPQGGPYLTTAQLCQVINWVNAGAP